MRVSALGTAVKAQLAMMWSLLAGFVDGRLQEADMPEGSGLTVKAKQAGTVISVVVIGVIALVGTLIFGEIYNALPLGDAVFSSGGALEGVPDSIVSGFGDAVGLVPIVLLVLLASVVIGVVQRMR
jgi:hypothetical protein